MNTNYTVGKFERPLDEEELRGVRRREVANELQQETVEWLLNLAPWDCFFTCTFAKRVPRLESARSVFVYWMKRWPGVPVFYAVEQHPGGHGAHLHGLMALAHRGIQRTALWESWFDVYGRNSFLPPRSPGAVAGYCASGSVLEVLKDGCWGLLGVSMNRRKVHQARSRAEAHTACSAARSSDFSGPVDAGIEEEKIEGVDLWGRPHLAVP